jgi:hypothetical protein
MASPFSAAVTLNSPGGYARAPSCNQQDVGLTGAFPPQGKSAEKKSEISSKEKIGDVWKHRVDFLFPKASATGGGHVQSADHRN